MTDEQIASICDRVKYEILSGDEYKRRQGLSAEEFDELTKQNLEVQQELRSALARGDLEVARNGLGNLLFLLNIELDCDEDSYRRLAYGYLTAMTESAEIIGRRNQSEPVKTETIVQENKPLFPVHAGAVEDETLQLLFEHWRDAISGRSEKTISDFENVIKAFCEFTQQTPAKQLTRSHFNCYRDHLLQKEGLHYRTVEKKLSFLRAVLQHAVENEKIESNPAARIKVSRPKVKQLARLPYDTEDLKLILGSRLYTQKERPKGGAGDTAVWLPLLAMFTGARLEELGQLRLDDIKHYEGDDRYIEIGDLGEGQVVKTESSRRRVPIHSRLIDAGLLRYHKKLEEKEEALLFPLLKTDCKGSLTGNWSKWWGRYAREQIGIADERKVFHSFRHAFKDICREVGIFEEVHDALSGHVNGGVGWHYGSGRYLLKPLFEAMRRINYAGVEIPTIISA